MGVTGRLPRRPDLRICRDAKADYSRSIGKAADWAFQTASYLEERLTGSADLVPHSTTDRIYRAKGQLGITWIVKDVWIYSRPRFTLDELTPLMDRLYTALSSLDKALCEARGARKDPAATRRLMHSAGDPSAVLGIYYARGAQDGGSVCTRTPWRVLAGIPTGQGSPNHGTF